MKDIDDLNLPEDIHYSKDHELARQENGEIRIGIDDYAQDQLGEVVYVELPQVGATFEQGAEFGTVESVKAVAELYMPIPLGPTNLTPPSQAILTTSSSSTFPSVPISAKPAVIMTAPLIPFLTQSLIAWGTIAAGKRLLPDA